MNETSSQLGNTNNANRSNEEVMKEAEEYFKIAKHQRDNKWRYDEEEMIIMDRKWLKQWKEYVNYSFIKRKAVYTHYYSMNKIKDYEVKPQLCPGKIDNTRILVSFKDFLNDGDLTNQNNLVIREGLNQRDDIKICTRRMWEFFYSIYGGGPTIIRKYITEGGIYSSKKVVELYFRCIKIITIPQRRKLNKDLILSLKSSQLFISRTKTLSDLKQRFIELENYLINKTEAGSKEISDKNIRLWKLNSNSVLNDLQEFIIQNIDDLINTDLLINPEKVLDYLEYAPNIDLKELEFADTDICIVEYVDDVISPAIFDLKKIEIKDGKCDWCNHKKILKYFCPCKDVAYCTEYCKDRDTTYHVGRCKIKFKVEDDDEIFKRKNLKSKNGLVGLQNLGNTCFMNTSLQCMSNCYELSQYFLKDHFKAHINTDNPIGTQGVLAKAYSNLLKNLWLGDSSVYSPWNFKSAIETFQSMFTGYQQHDTQEFLNYLLDGLHEDLNKVVKKPFIEKDDSNKEDSVKAREQWIGFLRRNQSLLVDLFFGQYKSTLYCPDSSCNNISNTFDPFLSLSLPVAKGGEMYEITCFFIFYDTYLSPIQLILSFYNESATVMSLRNKIGKLLNVHPFSFVMLKMDSFGDLDFIPNSANPIKVEERHLHKNQIPYFCFQIDPKIFYSFENNTFKELDMSQLRDFGTLFEEIEKSKENFKYLWKEEYQEDSTFQTLDSINYYSQIKFRTAVGELKQGLIKYNTDNNNGLNDDWLRVTLHMRRYDEGYTELRKKLMFPRIICINKKWSTKKLHQVILNYFGSILRRFHNIKNEDLWDTFFPDIEETVMKTANLDLEEHRSKAYPYLLRVKNIFTEMGGKCIFCQRGHCNDCLLPCSENISVQQLLDKIPLNENMKIDNSYYYLNEKQRNNFSITDYDFKLDCAWLPIYLNEVKKLNDKKDFEIGIVRRSYREERVNINSCFKNFVQIEKLQENNEWFCPSCKQHQKADKKMELYKSPNILIIHLKRFRNNSKIDTVVEFPNVGLDISNYVISKEDGLSTLYDLFAIANHYGSLHGGHYVAYAQNHLDKNWYSFNDSSVNRISEDNLITSAAYVLFYRRRDWTSKVNIEDLYKKGFEDYESMTDIKNLKIK